VLSKTGAAELDAAELEAAELEAAELEAEELGVLTTMVQEANTTASVDINVPFLICMFIVYLLMNSYAFNIKVWLNRLMKIG
jgi:hypothetical protein